MRTLTFTLAALGAGPLMALALAAAPTTAAPTIAASCMPVFPGVVQIMTSVAVPPGSKVTITTRGAGVPPAPMTTALPASGARINYQLSSPSANGCLATVSAPASAASTSSSSGSDRSGHGGGGKAPPHCSAGKKVCGDDCIKTSDVCHKH